MANNFHIDWILASFEQLVVVNFYGQAKKRVGDEIVTLTHAETKNLLKSLEGHCCLLTGSDPNSFLS